MPLIFPAIVDLNFTPNSMAELSIVTDKVPGNVLLLQILFGAEEELMPLLKGTPLVILLYVESFITSVKGPVPVVALNINSIGCPLQTEPVDAITPFGNGFTATVAVANAAPTLE